MSCTWRCVIIPPRRRLHVKGNPLQPENVMHKATVLRYLKKIRTNSSRTRTDLSFLLRSEADARSGPDAVEHGS